MSFHGEVPQTLAALAQAHLSVMASNQNRQAAPAVPSHANHFPFLTHAIEPANDWRLGKIVYPRERGSHVAEQLCAFQVKFGLDATVVRNGQPQYELPPGFPVFNKQELEKLGVLPGEDIHSLLTGKTYIHGATQVLWNVVKDLRPDGFVLFHTGRTLFVEAEPSLPAQVNFTPVAVTVPVIADPIVADLAPEVDNDSPQFETLVGIGHQAPEIHHDSSPFETLLGSSHQAREVNNDSSPFERLLGFSHEALVRICPNIFHHTTTHLLYERVLDRTTVRDSVNGIDQNDLDLEWKCFVPAGNHLDPSLANSFLFLRRLPFRIDSLGRWYKTDQEYQKASQEGVDRYKVPSDTTLRVKGQIPPGQLAKTSDQRFWVDRGTGVMFVPTDGYPASDASDPKKPESTDANFVWRGLVTAVHPDGSRYQTEITFLRACNWLMMGHPPVQRMRYQPYVLKDIDMTPVLQSGRHMDQHNVRGAPAAVRAPPGVAMAPNSRYASFDVFSYSDEELTAWLDSYKVPVPTDNIDPSVWYIAANKRKYQRQLYNAIVDDSAIADKSGSTGYQYFARDTEKPKTHCEKDIRAVVLAVIDTLIELHTKGLPLEHSSMDWAPIPGPKKQSGFRRNGADLTGSAEQRFQDICHAVRKCKQICHDLLSQCSSEKRKIFVNAPSAYLSRKDTNRNSNTGRYMVKKPPKVAATHGPAKKTKRGLDEGLRDSDAGGEVDEEFSSPSEAAQHRGETEESAEDDTDMPARKRQKRGVQEQTTATDIVGSSEQTE